MTKRCIQFLPCADGVNEAYCITSFKILHYNIHFNAVKSLQHQELTDSMVLYIHHTVCADYSYVITTCTSICPYFNVNFTFHSVDVINFHTGKPKLC